MLSKLLLILFSCFIWSFSSAQDSISFHHIRVSGNKKTKTHIILRELDIKKHQNYALKDTAELFDINRNKIFNTKLFNFVNLIVSADSITIKVEERWYIFPSPIFDVGDRNFNEWWTDRGRDPSRLIYGIHMKHNNFRGRNERLNLKLQFGFIRTFQLDYRIPYIDKNQKIGLNVQASYSNNRTVSFRTTDQKLEYVESESLLRERRKFGLAVL